MKDTCKVVFAKVTCDTTFLNINSFTSISDEV